MDNEENRKEMYFILTGNKHPLVADMEAVPRLGRIHSQNRINNLFLREDEDFLLAQQYCGENKFSPISLTRITDSSQILFYTAGESPESRRFAYISNSETEESLAELKCLLQRRDFSVR